MNKNDDKIIHEMYKNIETPEYDVTKDVLKRIKNVPRKNIALRRVLIIAAVLCLVAAALGAVELIGWQSFNLFGKRVENENITASTPIPPNMQNADPFTEQDNLFVSDSQLGESRLVVLEGGSGGTSGIGSYDSGDLNAIAAYVNNASSPLLLPSYIPDGYVFTKGKVELYLDVKSLDSELVSSEVKDGKIYEIYKLPEGYDKKIRAVTLNYLGENGEKLRYQIMLSYALNENTAFSHGAPESAEAEQIKILGFDEAIMIHDGEKSNFYLNIAVLYKEIPEINAVFSLVFALHPSENMPHFSEEAYIETYSAFIVSIKTESLSVEELIKIAESIN